MWLLVEFQEGYTNLGECGHPSTIHLEDDYYNPQVICETKEELLEWLRINIGENIEMNGDTFTVHKKNWKGEPKGSYIYHALHVEFGKTIVF